MSTIGIKSATKGYFHHSYNPATVTSMDFSELTPLRCIESVLGDKWNKIHGECKLMLAPQVFPPFGKAYHKVAAFFVPEHQLIQDSEALHVNQATFLGDSVVAPYIENFHINYIFSDSPAWAPVAPWNLATKVHTSIRPQQDTLPDYDFVHIKNGGSNVCQYDFFQLTTYGKRLFKTLKLLGYDFASYEMPLGTGSTLQYDVVKAATLTELNALPLLAYLKIYVDYFLTGPRYNNSILSAFSHAVLDKKDFAVSPNTLYTASTGQISAYGLYTILHDSLLPHMQNMYTEAWQSPNFPISSINDLNENNVGPSSGLIGPHIPQATVDATRVSSDGSGTYISSPVSGTPIQNISAFGLRVLNVVDSIVRRFGLSGSKAVQRLYAQFGLEPHDFKSNYVKKIYEGQTRIVFHPVMSNADTGTAVTSKSLGSFAGMGLSSMSFDFNYQSSDYGFIIVLSWIQVVPMLRRGFDPMTLRRKPYDWYTPQFDGKAFRAIPEMELGVVYGTPGTVPSMTDREIFGFTRLYEEYRNLRDSIAGDFVIGRAQSFVLCRDLSWFRSAKGYIQAQQDQLEYYNKDSNPDMSDPFQYDDTVGDRFWLSCEFDIEAERPISSTAYAVDLDGEGDVALPVNGNLMN